MDTFYSRTLLYVCQIGLKIYWRTDLCNNRSSSASELSLGFLKDVCCPEGSSYVNFFAAFAFDDIPMSMADEAVWKVVAMVLLISANLCFNPLLL